VVLERPDRVEDPHDAATPSTVAANTSQPSPFSSIIPPLVLIGPGANASDIGYCSTDYPAPPPAESQPIASAPTHSGRFSGSMAGCCLFNRRPRRNSLRPLSSAGETARRREIAQIEKTSHFQVEHLQTRAAVFGSDIRSPETRGLPPTPLCSP